MRRNDAVGQYGERVAERHLLEQGMALLDRNWRCDVGEIDIVALDGGIVVVCEVKTRTGLMFGSGLEAITPAKARRLRRLAVRWMLECGPGRVPPGAEVRVDIIAVHRHPRGAATVEHVRGAL